MNSSRITSPASLHASDDAAPSLTRRRFMQYLSASTSLLALQACGGGGGGSANAAAPVTATDPVSSSPSTPTIAAPVWKTVPTLSFTQGVASSISISPYVTGPAGVTLAIALNTGAVALPAGVTYNSAAQTLDYDGVGAAASSDGHILTATAG